STLFFSTNLSHSAISTLSLHDALPISGQVVSSVAKTLATWESPAEIIVGSIRHIADVNEAIQAGANVLTVPPKFFPQMCSHPKTDRKSTRLNSSHLGISYAVFCLKKKK